MTSREKRLKQQAKRERRMERREERWAEEQRLRTRRRIRLAGMGLLALVVVGALGFGYWFAFLQPRPGTSVSTSGASDHSGVPRGGYSTSPPTSGPHSPQVADWGEQNEIPEILQVHALEHGGVLVQYNCPTSCSELVANLRSITRDYDSRVILAPYSRMESRIALTSWGKIDLLDEFDRERIEEFVKKNRNNAPENVP
jgi:hypothetical protein